MGRDKVNELDKVVDSCWLIAKGLLESTYSCDSEGYGKMEIVDNGNSVEYI